MSINYEGNNSPRGFSKSQQFWSQSLTFKASTFGSTVKVPENSLDLSPKPLEKKAANWRGKDEYGHSHSRLQIASVFGKLPINPGPGQYNPDHEKLSRRINGPHITLGERHNNTLSDALKKSYTIRDMDEEVVIKKPRKKKTTTDEYSSKKKTSVFSSISIPEMRKLQAPGPGTYKNGDIDKIVKFERSPVALLAPRTETKARAVITLDTLDIVVSRKDKGSGFRYGGDYDLGRDPRKVEISKSIGERRPLLGQREQLNVGPGYYNPQKANPFGESSRISPSKKTLGV